MRGGRRERQGKKVSKWERESTGEREGGRKGGRKCEKTDRKGGREGGREGEELTFPPPVTSTYCTCTCI